MTMTEENAGKVENQDVWVPNGVQLGKKEQTAHCLHYQKWESLPVFK